LQRTGGLELAMIENLVREDLSPVDEAYGYQRLLDSGLTRKEIAAKVPQAAGPDPRAAVQYPVAQFSLDEQANKDLAALLPAAKRRRRPGHDPVRSRGGRAGDPARRRPPGESGVQSLIVGEDVAAQLAGGYLKGQLKAHRADDAASASTSASGGPASQATSPTRR
jgi:hypothetical protein